MQRDQAVFSGGLARTTLNRLVWWVLLSAIGSVFSLMVFRSPAAVVGVIAAGVFLLLADIAVNVGIVQVVLRRKWKVQARGLAWSVNVASTGVVVLVAWLVAHGTLERVLWHTGGFGEAPFNRTVTAREIRSANGLGSAWLVEWRVEKWRTDGAYASANFDTDMTDGWHWFGPPGMTEPLSREEAVGFGPGMYNRMKEACCAGARFESADVTPLDSYYFYAEFDRPTHMLECYFGNATEEDVPDRDCTDGDVRAYMIPLGTTD